MVSNKEVRVKYIRMKFFSEDGEAPEQIAKISCGCPTSGSIEGQVGWDSDSLIWWVIPSPWQRDETR